MGISINNHLALRVNGGPGNSTLCPIVEAGQDYPGDRSSGVDAPISMAGVSRAELGNRVVHAAQRISDILCELIPAHRPDDANPHPATSSRLIYLATTVPHSVSMDESYA